MCKQDTMKFLIGNTGILFQSFEITARSIPADNPVGSVGKWSFINNTIEITPWNIVPETPGDREDMMNINVFREVGTEVYFGGRQPVFCIFVKEQSIYSLVCSAVPGAQSM